MVSIIRQIRNARKAGLKEWFRMMTYIGDAKNGRLVGTDSMGNRYYENLDATQEIPGRHRWVDYAQDDFNASQAVPEWHSWLHGIRKDPPHEDPIVNAARPPWLAPFKENLTGTRGAYKTYSTVVPKIRTWEPIVKARGGGGGGGAAPSA